MTDAHSIQGDAAGRGVTILTLGILSIVLAGCAPAGLILGWLAIGKAGHDLPRIDAGVIDQQARPLTQAGRVCGIIGLILSALSLLGWILQLLFGIAIIGGAATGS